MQAQRRILVVDGDARRREALVEQLERDAEFAIVQQEDAAATLDLVRREPFDAILLDVALAETDGRALCRHLRQAGVAAPILLLGPGPGEAGPAALPESGADDYLARPFRITTLLECLRAHLRRRGPKVGAGLTIGPYTFRPDAKLLSDNSGRRTVRLTDKEAAILEFLYRAGRTIGRDTLLGEVWGYNSGVATHTLETHVYRLRRKIERDPAHAEILVTEPGGYRLLR
jgi:DNA-binding response OmpR family regulator